MKHQITITIEEEVMIEMKEQVRQGTFRNKSHMFEFAIRKLLKDVNQNDKT